MSNDGGLVWSHTNVATTQEIVDCFDRLELKDIVAHNWRTAPLDRQGRWDVTEETYLNGVPLILDFDYRMGFLVEAVDRTSGQCTYVAIVHYHGRRHDGTWERDYCTWPGTHQFFGHDDGYSPVTVAKWAVDVIHDMVEAHDEARPRP